MRTTLLFGPVQLNRNHKKVPDLQEYIFIRQIASYRVRVSSHPIPSHSTSFDITSTLCHSHSTKFVLSCQSCIIQSYLNTFRFFFVQLNLHLTLSLSITTHSLFGHYVSNSLMLYAPTVYVFVYQLLSRSLTLRYILSLHPVTVELTLTSTTFPSITCLPFEPIGSHCHALRLRTFTVPSRIIYILGIYDIIIMKI